MTGIDNITIASIDPGTILDRVASERSFQLSFCAELCSGTNNCFTFPIVNLIQLCPEYCLFDLIGPSSLFLPEIRSDTRDDGGNADKGID